MRAHPIQRLSAIALTVGVWAVLAASAASAKTPPDDPSAVFITQPAVVVVEAVGWTRYALVAMAACLIGVAATLAVQMVAHHAHRHSMAHA
jgi:hypothetical protein